MVNGEQSMFKRLLQRLPCVSNQRRVWFYRDYEGFPGCHLKHAHYYQNTQALSGYRAEVIFSRDAVSKTECLERQTLWPQPSSAISEWLPENQDVLFLAGLDWGYVLSQGGPALTLPKINLIQHVRHADKDTELYGFLANKAIRICVSQEVADAILATGKVNGPVFAIPNGVDVPGLSNAELDARCEVDTNQHRVLIVGYKMPALAGELSAILQKRGIEHRLIDQLMDRQQFLALLKEHSIVVCCPNFTEGFYLPALEVMAAGSLLVVPDCEGNRGFCVDRKTCIMPEYTPVQMAQSVEDALCLPVLQRRQLLQSAMEKVNEHSLGREREAFHNILKSVESLW